MYQKDKLADLIAVKPATPVPFTLASLIAWLETRDPGEWYRYTDAETCMLGKYTTSLGGEFCLFEEVYKIGNHSLPALGHDFAVYIARPYPQTMRSALIRARAYAGAKS